MLKTPSESSYAATERMYMCKAMPIPYITWRPITMFWHDCHLEDDRLRHAVHWTVLLKLPRSPYSSREGPLPKPRSQSCRNIRSLFSSLHILNNFESAMQPTSLPSPIHTQLLLFPDIPPPQPSRTLYTSPSPQPCSTPATSQATAAPTPTSWSYAPRPRWLLLKTVCASVKKIAAPRFWHKIWIVMAVGIES